MGQDIYASIGLTTDYRREDSSSMSGRITNDPRHSVLRSNKATKVHPTLCDMLNVLSSEISARTCTLCWPQCYTTKCGYIFLTKSYNWASFTNEIS
jgi:hypothetical protein